jgi:hypothetical protein
LYPHLVRCLPSIKSKGFLSVLALPLTSIQTRVKWSGILNIKFSRLIRSCRDFQTISDHSFPSPLNGVYSRLLRGNVTALAWVRNELTFTTIKILFHSIYRVVHKFVRWCSFCARSTHERVTLGVWHRWHVIRYAVWAQTPGVKIWCLFESVKRTFGIPTISLSLQQCSVIRSLYLREKTNAQIVSKLEVAYHWEALRIR